MMNKRLKHALIPVYQRLVTFRGGTALQPRNGKPRAFIMLGPDYGNVGDLAIGVAQDAFLERTLPGYEIVSVPLAGTYSSLRSLRKQAKQGDVVFLVGGGNTGDLYPLAHFGRNFIVRYLRDLPIISFPQSVIYSSDDARRVFGERERRAIGRHPRLTLFARERSSLRILKEIHGERIGYAPDIVLSFRPSRPISERDSALLVLRSDTERLRTGADDAAIYSVIESLGLPAVVQDHEIDPRILDSKSALEVVNEMFDLYWRAKIVITDRLHGMIFAAITGTPCVVLPNTNHKISGTYEAWLRDRCPYIVFTTECDRASIESAIEQAATGATTSTELPTLDFGEFERVIMEYAIQDERARDGGA